ELRCACSEVLSADRELCQAGLRRVRCSAYQLGEATGHGAGTELKTGVRAVGVSRLIDTGDELVGVVLCASDLGTEASVHCFEGSDPLDDLADFGSTDRGACDTGHVVLEVGDVRVDLSRGHLDLRCGHGCIAVEETQVSGNLAEITGDSCHAVRHRNGASIEPLRPDKRVCRASGDL